jgi:ATP-binding cassette subfamily B protein
VTGIPSLLPHEDPEASDVIASAERGAWRLANTGYVLTFLIGTTASVATVGAVLASVSPWLLLVMGPAVVVALVGQSTGMEVVRTYDELQADQRLVDRLHDILWFPRHGVEVRCSGAGPALIDRVDEVATERQRKLVAASRRINLRMGAARVGFGVAQGAVVVAAVLMARAGSASVGDVVMLMLLVPQLTGLATGLMQGLHGISQTLAGLGKLVWIDEYAAEHGWRDAVALPPSSLRHGLVLRDVTFSYGTGAPALRDLSLQVPAGSSLALVGANGAGKSTLVKLLARLYDPSSGDVLVDGVPLRTIDPTAWRERTSAAFQDFAAFEFLVRETVGIGSVADMGDLALVGQAVADGDASTVVADVEGGLQAQLGARFSGGTELSGGQWQRLALARGFMRRAPLLMLLDEPTSALDAEAEHTIFERFAEAAHRVARTTGGVTVIVSHRMSTARLADRIAVLDGGRVVETGTHDELVARGGRYAELFELQAARYR